MRWKSRSLASKRTRSRWSLVVSRWRFAMWNGTVESIHIASTAQGQTQSVPQATAVPGAGLEGDRYALKLGTFYKPAPDHELTLIEAEAIEALRLDYRLQLAPGEARPNNVTRHAPLNHLIGKKFSIRD